MKAPTEAQAAAVAWDDAAQGWDQHSALIRDWLREASPITFINIDSSVGPEGGEGRALHETIPDETVPPPSAGLERAELWQLVAQRIDSLPEIQKRVLAMYHFEGFRLAEIAEAMDLTEARISQINTQAILALRVFVERNQNK